MNTIIPFEKDFESKDYVDSLKVWMSLNWQMSIIYSIIYIISIFSIKFLMRNRIKYDLKYFLLIWNLMLSIFSITGAIRVLPRFWQILTQNGITYSVCDNKYAYGITGYWSYLFIMSKLPELVDTLFIVLRKQPLIFLHWYHHATVLIYCWYSYHDFTASGLWFMTMNYVVHSLMYSYYALKTLKFKIPGFVSKLITSLQLAQMVVGCYVNYVAYKQKQQGNSCAISHENIKYSFLMYLSYFALFFHFFLNSYVFKIKRSSTQSIDLNNNNIIKNGKQKLN